MQIRTALGLALPLAAACLPAHDPGRRRDLLVDDRRLELWREERQWTSALGSLCDKARRLYCFEDGELED